MNLDIPLVSILMPAYNAEKFIEAAIRSVLNLHYKNWELIIVDDKSDDETLSIINKIKLEDNRIKVYSNEKNLGDYPNRNRTASFAKGKYLKYLDNDDLIYKYSLDYMVEAMEKTPEAALGLGFILVDDLQPYPQVYQPRETYREQYLGIGFLGYGPSAAIISRTCFEESGGFSNELFSGDQELWLRLALKYPVIKLQPALIWYRRHPAQESSRENDIWESTNRRYKLSINYLLKAKEHFTKMELKESLKNNKKLHARLLLKILIINRQYKKFYYLWKKSNLNIFELLSGLVK